MARARLIENKTIDAMIIITILGVFILSGCDYQCEEKIEREVISPNGKYMAVIFEQNCGATTSILYHVNIRPSDSRYKFKKDDQGHIMDGRVFTGYGDIKWVDDQHLLIEYKEVEGVDYSKSCHSPWKDVTIECKAQK